MRLEDESGVLTLDDFISMSLQILDCKKCACPGLYR